MNTNYEYEIDLIDLLHYIFTKWRSIIIVMLIGAIIAGALSYINPSMANKSNAVTVDVITTQELNDLRDALEDREVEEVLLQYDTYTINKQKYEELLQYSQDSIPYVLG